MPGSHSRPQGGALPSRRPTRRPGRFTPAGRAFRAAAAAARAFAARHRLTWADALFALAVAVNLAALAAAGLPGFPL